MAKSARSARSLPVGRLYSVRDAAARLGLQPITLRKWIMRRRIAAVHLSRRCVRIPESELDRVISDGFVGAAGGEL